MSGFTISSTDSSRFKFLRIYCEVTAIAVVALGSLVLLGWALHVEVLNTVFPGLVAVSANMALLLIFSGTSLGLLLPGEPGTVTRYVARFVALLVTMAGSAMRAETLFHVNLGIDQLLFREPVGALAAAFPGRMSPTSSTAFMAIGAGLLLLEWKTKNGRRPSQGLGLWTALVGLIAIICYTYHATSLKNGIWLYTQIAMPMAIALFVLGFAIFFARPRSGITGDLTGEGSGSVMARRFLPAVFFIPLLLGWICLHGQRARFYGSALGLAIYSTSNVVIFGFLVWLNARKMNEEHAQRSAAETEIRTLNAELEARVAERTEALRNSEAHLSYSAQHDFLTGLPNRMLFNDRVNQAIVYAPRINKKLAVLFLDLDGFKHINDSLGHPIGDKLLQSIASRLVKCVRATDTVSRQGGDEFVVLLSEMAHSEDAAITARRMLQEVAEAHSVDEHNLYVTASIGLSVYPDDGRDAETLIKNADTAMYQAKENGRQNYQFFKAAMNVRAVARQSIEESLRRALERQEFSLVFQPKVSLKSGEITGAEALLRWTHPTRGPMSPAKFVPVAEDSGLIVAIDKWVLREACIQARGWTDAGLPKVSVGVNVSAMEFRNEKFLEGIFGILAETGLDPRCLELELTESVLMKRPASTEAILKTLRARGVRLAVDDFGTGYSSLSYLRKFSMDILKIDQSFVRQITTAPEEASIVTAMISMARSLNLRVVAEGVETQEELTFLQERQCDEAQGFYFSRPVVSADFAKLLATGIPEPVSTGLKF
ncbi:MAG: EAL domain-containing protein [Candidatus Acidiferrales bacterium]